MIRIRSAMVWTAAGLAVMVLGGCAVVLSPLPAVLVSNVTAPVTYEAGSAEQPYEVLGEVEGKSTATSIFGIFSSGDASVYKAYKNALSKIPESDRLIEVTVDYKATSTLGLVATYTTLVRGKAIRYRLEGPTTGQRELRKFGEGVTRTRSSPELVGKLEEWRSKVSDQVKWDYQLRDQWYWYKKRNKLDIDRDEWVRSLTEEDYRSYLGSGLSLSKWLEKVLSR